MRKGLLICLFSISFAVGLSAHEYIMNDNASISWYSASTEITALTLGTWDDGYYDLALPSKYQFYYYGKKVTHLRISTNGYVVPGFGSAFGFGAAYSNDPIPALNPPDSVVAPLWCDWYLESTGTMWYGFVNNTYTAVEWRNVPHYADPTASYTFGVLFTTHDHFNYPDSIIFWYNDVTAGAGNAYDNGKSATVGIEHYAGTQGEEYSYNTALINNGDRILFTPFVPIYGSTLDHADFDGLADLVIWRPDDGNWFFKNSDGSTFVWNFGTKGDIPVPGDYDGDSDADERVVRPSSYHWFCNSPPFIKQWGTTGDIPVPADFNGDGKLDMVVWRPNGGYWFIYHTGVGTTEVIQFGTQGDVPLPADYDMDTKADCAVYRPSSGLWFIRKSSNPASNWIVQWGTDGDIPMPANFNSASYSTITVYRPSNGYWFSYDQTNGSSALRQWGAEGDHPVPCFDYGALSDHVVFRPEEGNWYIRASNFFNTVEPWGTMGDKPRYRYTFRVVSPSYGDRDLK